MMDKFHPGYFGKVGMRHFNLRKNGYHCPSVNLDKLWALVGGPDSEAVKKASSGGGAPVIDLTHYNIFKLLGKGQLPAKPVVVRAKFVSKRAEEKIRAVGGAVELIA
jgi:large subunit ribosomal protein L27Ae